MRVILILGITLLISVVVLAQGSNRQNLENSTLKLDEIKSRRRLATTTDDTYKLLVCDNEGLDPSGGNLFSSDDEDKFKKNRNKLIKSEGNPFRQYFIDDDQDKAVSTATTAYGGPAVLIALFIIFSYPIGYFCYYCCACMPDRCCPPCKLCCKKCLCISCSREEPYAGFSKLWPIVGMFVFLGWMAIAAIIGLAYTSGIEESYKKFRCTTIYFLYSVNAGDDSSWGGIDNMYDVLDKLKDDLSTISTDIGTKLKGCDTSTASALCISTQKTALDTAKTDLAINLASTTNFKNLFNVDTNNAAIFTTNGSYKLNPDQSLSSTLQPSAFFYRGSSGSSSSIYDRLVDALGTLGDQAVIAIQNALTGIEDAGNSILDTSTFQGAIDDGLNAIEDQRTFMEDQMKSLYDSTDTPGEYMSTLTQILNAIFGGFLGLSLLVAVFGALMVAFNWFKLRIVIHLCWALFTLLTFVSMTVAFILYALSIIGFSGCEYMGYDVFKWDDPDFNESNPEWTTLNNKIFKLSGDSEKIARACFKALGGNGDIFEPLGVRGELDDFDTVFDFEDQQNEFDDSLAVVNAEIATVKTVFVNLFSLSKVIYDGTSTDEHPDLANALTAANGAFQAGNFGARFYASNINSVTAAVDYNPFPTAGATGASVVNYWIGDLWQAAAGTVTTTVTTTDFYITSDGTNDQRFVPGTATGGTSAAFDTAYTTYMAPILNWRNAKDAVTINQLRKVLAYQTAFTAIKTKIDSAFVSINDALTNLGTKLDGVVHPTTGLLGTQNKCYFIGNGINDALKSVCWGFFPSLYMITEALIFVAVGMGLASFFLCCTAMRYSKNLILQNRKTNVLNPGNPQTSAKTGGN